MAGAALAAIFAVGVSVNPAHARTGCDSRATIIDGLKDVFQETPVAVGMEQSGNVVELLRARDGTSWTLVITRPDGISCIAAAGEHWNEIEQARSTEVPS